MNFIALDFETANRNRSSICQVGIAEFRDGKCTENAAWLVDPREDFDDACIGVHGITSEHVQGSPTFDSIYATELGPRLAGKIVVCHTSFDRVALERACDRHGHPTPDVTWLDSATLARRVWPEVSRSGYGLKNLAVNRLGIEFRHHDAGEDARAAGLVVLAAAESLGLSMDGCLGLLAPRNPNGGTKERRNANAEQRRSRGPAAPLEERELRRLFAGLVERTSTLADPPLAGETIVVTGRVQIGKKEVADGIEQLGGTWERDVTARTTMLVVGTQNLVALNGKEKSSNHTKAEQWITKGQELQIFSELEWLELLREIHGNEINE